MTCHITGIIAAKVGAKPLRQDQRIDRLMFLLSMKPALVDLPGRKRISRPLRSISRGDAVRIAVRWAERAGLDPVVFLGRSRLRRYAHPRQDFWRKVYENTTMSLPQIGDIFDRDHGTVLHGIKASAERAKAKQEEENT